MGPRILIIEDNEDIRDNTAELLSLEGFHVFTADCGLTGLSSAGENIPDLVICDVVMPGMDGYEVFDRLRADERTRHIPIIFTTAQSQQTDKQKALFHGIEDYLVKPFDEVELFKYIKKYLHQ